MPTVDVNGTTLHYETHGAGPALLLIHGLGSCGLDWEEQVAEFARDHRVIVPDLRGHGRSARPERGYSMRQFGDDLAALLRALDATPAHVVGISLGGGIAFQLALDHPDCVRSLVIVNSGPDAVPRTWALRLMIAMRRLTVRLRGLAPLGPMVAARLFPERGQEELRRRFVERFAGNTRGPYLASFDALIGWSVLPRMGEVRCPTLAIAADQDYTPVSMKEDWVARVPGAQLEVIAESHHALPMERPEAFNRALRKFLAAQPP